MIVKNILFLLFIPFSLLLKAQPGECTFKDAIVNINFGTGIIGDRNLTELYNYRHISRNCPSDGYYTYTSYTSDCFSGDWVTLTEDHTPGDADGNMMLVNASPRSGTFLSTTISRLKSGTIYEFSAWFTNVCKPTEKCPFPLLPNITILLQTPDGKVVTQMSTGELIRRYEPQWTRYQAVFTTPASETPLNLIMIDNAPGGCGNDFALDDIAFRECIIVKPIVKNTPKKPVVKKQAEAPKPVVKKPTPVPVVVKKPTPVEAVKKPTPVPEVVKKTTPVPEIVKKPVPAPQKKQPVVVKKPIPKKELRVDSNIIAKKREPVLSSPVAVKPPESQVITRPQTSLPTDSMPALKQRRTVLTPPPPAVSTRSNPLVKRLETEAGEIKVDLYDNGQIDGDTVSVYHNNILVVSHARLSIKPITLRIAIDAAHPHHELILVAHNLGSIPPNTSLMVVNAGTVRYEVFISSNEQKNAKVIFDLKE